MDIATIIGIIFGFVIVGSAIAMGGGAAGFVNIPSVFVTVGGTVAATLIAFSLREVKSVIAVTRKAFAHKADSIPDIIKDMLRFALKARREGILALESEIETVKDPFIQKSLQLAIDGTSPEIMEEVLRTEVQRIESRHELGQRLFKAMGTYAPAFGMIGTLVGLVQMLQNMSDPATIGPGMAVALLTTFYGALMANLLFLPMAAKLKMRSEQEVLVKEVVIGGILSIQSGDNPRIVEQKLQVFIAPKERSNALEEVSRDQRKGSA
jgi:chemotaxis protein MotA